MKFLAAYTEECYKDGKKLNLTNELENIIAKIEKNQTSKFLEKYKSPAVVKRAGGFRFIGYEKIFDGIIFIVLLKILVKGKPEYEKFCADSDLYCQKLLPDELWFKGQISKKENANIKERAKPNDIETEYLFTPIPDDFEGSILIYESKRFIQEIKKSDYKTQIAEIIREIFTDKELLSKTEKHHPSYSNLILYYKFFPNLNLLFLHQIVNSKLGEKHKVDEFEKICKSIDTKEGVLKESFRSYPEYVLYDTDVWLEIQNESEGNLALSTEEAQIFNSIIHNKYDEPLFPLFINGRAGSGKSTLLYYTYAHVLLNHIVQIKKVKNPPLFLTYSPKLLDTANSSIKKILKTNVKIRTQLLNEQVQYVDKYINSSEYNESFKTFREFQKQLLTSTEKELYQDSNYYRFANFKEDWNKYCRTNPSKYIRGITSEFAWYVIRTFIKGMRSSKDEFLEPDEYANLPRELKTVERETYEKIYESVFKNWYKNHLESNNYWDDQDLTRSVLENIDILNLEYPAVFCDEAQDFSNIELELISELSFFSKRKLEFRDVKRIPLAFAGDPLQTINPTGFKWETIKASFYEKVQNDFGRYGKVPLNFKELNNNYRSSRPIVTFNNIIQLIRALLFNLKDVSPQKSWFSSDFSINPTLKIDELSIIEEALKEEGKTRTIIIPCEEDQEMDYVLNRDFFLKEKAIINDEISQNIWSPMNVKGLEYNTVIVYNFGEYLANSLSININDLIKQLISSDNFQIDLQESKRIELEYFLNKLYVATSRAKKNLVIIDTNQGNKYLWALFNDYLKELPIKFSVAVDDSINWDEDNEISEFQFSSEVLDLADDKPEDLAKQYYQDGLNSSNPRKLRSAAEYFKVSQKPTETNRALAKAYELENNYLKAAEYYEKIQDGDKAIQCLWKSNDSDKFAKINVVYESLPKNPNNIFYIASRFMLSNNKNSDSILFLRNLSKLIRESENFEFYMVVHKSWYNIYDELLKALVKYSEDYPTLSDWDEAITILKSLNEIGILLKNKPEYLQLLFNLKQYQDVIIELKEREDIDNILFIKANAMAQKFPNNLEYFYSLKDYSKIVELFDANKVDGLQLSKENIEFIFKSIIEIKNLPLLETFLWTYIKQVDSLFDDKLLEKFLLLTYNTSLQSLAMFVFRTIDRREDEFFAQLLKNQYEKGEKNFNSYILAIFLIHEIKHNRIHTVVDLLEGKRAEFNFIKSENINKATLDKVLLHEFSLMKEPLNTSFEPKRRIQQYLKNLLIEDKRWIGLTEIKVAGSAIEKANYNILSRDFYESIFNSDLFDEEEIQFAKMRWLKVKMRQATDIEEEKAKKQFIEEIHKQYKKWDFDYEFKIDELDEYPETDINYALSLDESYTSKDLKKITISPIEYKTSIYRNSMELFLIKTISGKNTLKIDNSITNETIYFDILKSSISSMEGIVINQSNIENDNIQYSIEAWDLNLTYIRGTEHTLLTFLIDKNSKPVLTIYLS